MKSEIRQDRLVKEYAQLASRYDSKWSFYIEATTRETIARLPLAADDRLLDLGCGTGVLLHRLSAIHPINQLVGVEPVPEMRALARRKLLPAIELYEGWAERLPFADAQFDIVVSCNMFHYIEQPLDALIEIQRILRPRGRLVITDWCGNYLACRLFERYQRLRGRPHARIYRVHDCVRLVEQAGYKAVEIDTYKLNWLWGIMTVQCNLASA